MSKKYDRAMSRTVTGTGPWKVSGLGSEPMRRVDQLAGVLECEVPEHDRCSHVLAVELQTPDWQRATPVLKEFPHETWPDWVKAPRTWQAAAVEEITEAFGMHKVVIVDGPTGVGKTLIAEMARRELGTRGIYCCTTKSLQDQFAADFPYSRVLKGRSNYESCTRGVTCDLCTGRDCVWCPAKSQCAYVVDKSRMMTARVGVVNTAWFLAAANHTGDFGERRRREDDRLVREPFVTFDECDELERSLMGFVELRISERMVGELDLVVPKKGSHMTTIGRWLQEEVKPAVTSAAGRIEGSDDPKTVAAYLRLTRLEADIAGVISRGVEENCVRDYEDEGGLVLKPVRVDGIAERYLWRHCDRALLMSATASPISELADSLGLAEGEYGTVEIGSPFAVENRPIYVRPTADMSSKPEGSEPEVELAKMIAGIEEVLGGAEGNVLVHTNSYRLTKQLRDGVRDPRGRPALAYYTSRNRQQVLRIFTNTGGVLYAPSLERGIDLPDDHCRTIIIAKVPYPYLGDRQTSARLNSYAGRLWYTCQTVRTIVQQCGRGVRHQDDWAVTWVLDSQMMKMLKSNNRPLFPRWWDEAVEIV